MDHGLAYECDCDRPINLDQIGRLELFAENFHEIEARLPCDCGSIEPRSWLIRGAILAHDCRAIVAINRHLLPDQTARIFGQKFPLKTDVLSCFLLTLD